MAGRQRSSGSAWSIPRPGDALDVGWHEEFLLQVSWPPRKSSYRSRYRAGPTDRIAMGDPDGQRNLKHGLAGFREACYYQGHGGITRRTR